MIKVRIWAAAVYINSHPKKYILPIGSALIALN